jgi:hypothetical protein
VSTRESARAVPESSVDQADGKSDSPPAPDPAPLAQVWRMVALVRRVSANHSAPQLKEFVCLFPDYDDL